MEECVVMSGTLSDPVLAYVEECDCCGDSFGLFDLTLEGTQLLCPECHKT
jgi:hypothetical protein